MDQLFVQSSLKVTYTLFKKALIIREIVFFCNKSRVSFGMDLE